MANDDESAQSDRRELREANVPVELELGRTVDPSAVSWINTDSGSGVASTGALGSLSITETGTWSYNVDNSKVQYLGEGETKVETFTVASVDGTTHTVTITITGVNDGASNSSSVIRSSSCSRPATTS